MAHTPAQTPRAHAPRHKHTHHEKPPPTPRKRPPPRPADPRQEWRGTATRATPKRGKQPRTPAAGGPQPGVARDRTRGPQPGVATNTHHHRQQKAARSGGETHAGTSAKSGEGPPTHQPHPHPHLHQQQAPARETNRHTPPHTREHTRKTHPHPHHRHKHTTHTPARAAPQTHATRETTHQTPRKRPPPQPADPSQEWRGTAPRTLSQGWRAATHHQHQRALSQEWRGTAPGAPSQEWRGNAYPEPTAGSEGRRPANRRTLARSGEGAPPTNTRGPRPGVAGSHTQDPAPKPGLAGDHPSPPAANHNQGRRGHTHKQQVQERRTAAPQPPRPHPGETGNPPPQTTHRKGGRDKKGPRETQ